MKLKSTPCVVDILFCCWPKPLHATTSFSLVPLYLVDTRLFLFFLACARYGSCECGSHALCVWASRADFPLPFSCWILLLMLIFFVLFLFCCVILTFELREIVSIWGICLTARSIKLISLGKIYAYVFKSNMPLKWSVHVV